MARSPIDLDDADLDFLAERHLGTLTTLRADGRPHVVAIAFSFDPATGTARIISNAASQKIRNVERTGWAVVAQVDGPRWLSLEGPAVVERDPGAVAEAVAGFERRYRPTSENPRRVAIAISVERILGRATVSRPA